MNMFSTSSVNGSHQTNWLVDPDGACAGADIIYKTCTGARFRCQTALPEELSCPLADSNDPHYMEGKGARNTELAQRLIKKCANNDVNFIVQTAGGLASDLKCAKKTGENPEDLSWDNALNKKYDDIFVKCAREKEGKTCDQLLPLSQLPDHWHNNCQFVPLSQKAIAELLAAVPCLENLMSEALRRGVSDQRAIMVSDRQMIQLQNIIKCFVLLSLEPTRQEISSHSQEAPAIDAHPPPPYAPPYAPPYGQVVINHDSNSLHESINSLSLGQELIKNQLLMQSNRLADYGQRFNSLDTACEALQANREDSCYNGVLFWEINNVAQRKRDADRGERTYFFSSPFYTSRHGYKMCAEIFLNGSGEAVGTHCSLFFVILKGDYDATQRWPFRQRVQMKLLDQAAGKRHLKKCFWPSSKLPSFQKPTNERNQSWGFPKFMPQHELQNSWYVKDDIMYIQMKVDLFGLSDPLGNSP